MWVIYLQGLSPNGCILEAIFILENFISFSQVYQGVLFYRYDMINGVYSGMACLGLQSIVEGWDCGSYPILDLFQEACWHHFFQGCCLVNSCDYRICGAVGC